MQICTILLSDWDAETNAGSFHSTMVFCINSNTFASPIFSGKKQWVGLAAMAIKFRRKSFSNQEINLFPQWQVH
jgi:hypothetical protein